MTRLFAMLQVRSIGSRRDQASGSLSEMISFHIDSTNWRWRRYEDCERRPIFKRQIKNTQAGFSQRIFV